MDRLGIFVGSDRFPEYFQALAVAAGEMGLNVHLHFFGAGVRLVHGVDFDQLPASSRITICRDSVARLQLDDGPSSLWRRWLVPSGQLARAIQMCDRHLFL
ncbi:MAG: hypothetical protein P8X96_21860 [Desulfobacteraceae bacterium]